MANDFVTVTRTLVKRGWADVEAKLQWAFASGAAASFLLQIAQAYGIKVPEQVAVEIPYVFAIIAGYLVPSVGASIVQPNQDKVIREQHTGNVVTQITTGPIPIQASTQPQATAATNWLADAVQKHGENHDGQTQIIMDPH